MTTVDDMTSLRRRLGAAVAIRDQLIIEREERLSANKQRRARSDALRAAMYRTCRERERMVADARRNRSPSNGAAVNRSNGTAAISSNETAQAPL